MKTYSGSLCITTQFKCVYNQSLENILDTKYAARVFHINGIQINKLTKFRPLKMVELDKIKYIDLI